MVPMIFQFLFQGEQMISTIVVLTTITLYSRCLNFAPLWLHSVFQILWEYGVHVLSQCLPCQEDFKCSLWILIKSS